MKKKNLAWHFVRRVDGKDILRDGTEAPPDGKWLEHKGPLVICESGLHFSRHPFDALQYAPGEVLCMVEIGGEIIEPPGEDKGVCSRRKILKRGDMTELLRYFARMQALSVIHLWKHPDVVLDYLITGDESIIDAAYAASEAASAASWAASWAASRAASAASRAASWAASAASWAASWAEQRESFAMLVNEAFE